MKSQFTLLRGRWYVYRNTNRTKDAIDLTDLENGVYYMNVKVDGVTTTRAITVNK